MSATYLRLRIDDILLLKKQLHELSLDNNKLRGRVKELENGKESLVTVVQLCQCKEVSRDLSLNNEENKVDKVCDDYREESCILRC